MTDLVEIVARAMHDSFYTDDETDTYMREKGEEPLEDTLIDGYVNLAKAAQAAIDAHTAALKDAGFAVVLVAPTEAMVEAFWRNHPSPYETDMENEDAAKLCITAMIQAAG